MVRVVGKEGALIYVLLKLKYTPAVRSNILSKLIFASYV